MTTEEQVSDVTSEDVVGTGNDARIAMLAAINDSNDASRAEELVEYDENGQVLAFVPSDEETPLTTGDDEVVEKELQRAVDETTEEPATPRMVKLKVNGKEMEMTEDEVIHVINAINTW